MSATPTGIPTARLVRVEVRKMFNTRSGFWLMASIGIVALLTTVVVILFAPDEELGLKVFGVAVAFPMGVLLPIVAILAVTSEWSQRTGLITFSLVPRRGQLVWAKALAAVLVGVASMLLALLIGAVGNLVAGALEGQAPRWDASVAEMVGVVVTNVLGLLVGFMLGVLLRSSAAAIVGYFVYSFVVPTIFGVLAALQEWFRDVRPWVDFNLAQGALLDAPISGRDWAILGVSGLLWLVLPLTIGVRAVLRCEVK